MKFSKMKLFAALLALIMCLGAFVSCGDDGITLDGVKKDPYAAVKDGSVKYSDALSEKYADVCAVFDKVATGTGTYNIKFAPSVDADAPMDIIGAAAIPEIDAAFVVDSANRKYSGKVNLGMAGFNTNASIWGDKANIALNVPALLGDESYGLKLDTIEEDLKNSELFNLISGGMPYEEFKAALEENMGVSIDDITDMISGEAMAAAQENLVKELETIAKGLTAEVTEAKYGDVDVINVKYTVTKDDLAKVIDAVMKAFSPIVDAASTTVALPDINEALEELEIESVTLECKLKKDNGMLIGMVAVVPLDGSVTIDFNFGADVKNKIDMDVAITAVADDETLTFSISVDEVTEEGKGGINVTVKDPDGEEIKISAVRNDADGKYTVSATSPDGELFSLAGVLTYTADEFKLTADTISVEEADITIGTEISIKAGGTVEAVPEYKSILSMDITELQAFAMLFESFGGSDEGSTEVYDEDYDFDDEEYEYEIDYAGLEDAYDDLEDAYEGFEDALDDMEMEF